MHKIGIFKMIALVLLALVLFPMLAAAVELSRQADPVADLQSLGVFLAAGLGGMFAHYAKKWLRREINGSLIDYLLRDHPRETALAMLTFLGAAGTVYLSGQLTGLAIGPLLLTAFTVGYTCDSAINKGEK